MSALPAGFTTPTTPISVPIVEEPQEILLQEQELLVILRAQPETSVTWVKRVGQKFGFKTLTETEIQEMMTGEEEENEEELQWCEVCNGRGCQYCRG